MKKITYFLISCLLIVIVTAIGYMATSQPSSDSASAPSSSSSLSDSSKYKF